MYRVTIEGTTLEELKKGVIKRYGEVCREIGNNEIKQEQVETIESEAVPPVEQDAPSVEQVIPLAPVVEPPVESVDGILDSENIPWDKRIHNSIKTQSKLGVWKLRRNVDKALVQQVKAELVSNSAPTAPVPPAPIDSATPIVEAPKAITLPRIEVPPNPVEPSTASAPTSVVETTLTPTPIEAPSPAPIEAPPIPPLASASGHTLETFIADFHMIVGKLLTEGKLTQEYINELTAHFKVDKIWSVNDQQKAEMFDSFADFGFVQKVV